MLGIFKGSMHVRFVSSKRLKQLDILLHGQHDLLLLEQLFVLGLSLWLTILVVIDSLL